MQERLDIESKLSQALERANAATRAKAEFLANMSHELRTPLKSICGMSELLRDTSLNDAQRQCVPAFDASAGLLLALVNDILDLSKIDAGELELDPVDFVFEQVVAESLGASCRYGREWP